MVVSIEDSGPGFRSEDLPRVFDPFYTTRSGAPGLGLSLAQRFIESHGGSLSAENRETGGARLGIRLPITRD
jgi:signal transduction histidine kinase